MALTPAGYINGISIRGIGGVGHRPGVNQLQINFAPDPGPRNANGAPGGGAPLQDRSGSGGPYSAGWVPLARALTGAQIRLLVR